MANTADAAALMDRIYGPQRHIYDLTRKYYLLGRDRLIDGLNPGRGGRVLEIGCGTGRNLIQAARRHPQAMFYGVDISRAMLASADHAIWKAGLSCVVRVAQGDATAFDARRLLGEGAFERIFISYSLSMIPGWRAVLAHAMTLLAPGGELHIVDFGDQAGLPRWFRAALRAWLARFHVTPREGLEGELRVLAGAAGAALTFSRPYRGYSQSAVIRLAGSSANPAGRVLRLARLSGAL